MCHIHIPFSLFPYYLLLNLFFFFQAEDGIRDATVTGVQTCALPISCFWIFEPSSITSMSRLICRVSLRSRSATDTVSRYSCLRAVSRTRRVAAMSVRREIGRASCREGVGAAEDGGGIE